MRRRLVVFAAVLLIVITILAWVGVVPSALPITIIGIVSDLAAFLMVGKSMHLQNQDSKNFSLTNNPALDIHRSEAQLRVPEVYKFDCDLCSAKSPNQGTLRSLRWNQCSYCDQFYCPNCIEGRLLKKRHLLVFQHTICHSCGSHVGRGIGTIGGWNSTG